MDEERMIGREDWMKREEGDNGWRKNDWEREHMKRGEGDNG